MKLSMKLGVLVAVAALRLHGRSGGFGGEDR